MTGRTFKRLQLWGWRQFSEIDIEFHRRLTVLTGLNGTGKSSIISGLAQHLELGHGFLGTPSRSARGDIQWSTDVHNPRSDTTVVQLGGQNQIGILTYSDDLRTGVFLPNIVGGGGYKLEFAQVRPVAGLYMPSHTPLSSHHPIGQISVTPPTRENLLNGYNAALARAQYALNVTNGEAPHHQLKHALIALAYTGPGNDYIEADTNALELYQSFSAVLKTILPEHVGFKALEILAHEVLFETQSGKFSFDSLSGGLEVLVGMAWQMLLAAGATPEIAPPFIVLMDEPETHLHPAMQKQLLPTLMKAYPTAQFIVATHSPFIVTAEQDSNLYMLSTNSEHKVDSARIENFNRAGSANEALREALGLRETMPIWATNRLNEIVADFRSGDITTDRLDQLAQKLDSVGLGEYVPRSITTLIEEGNFD